MELGLSNRVAAIAASSQGLGFATALELAREGAVVSICSRDRGRIDAAADKIRGEVDGAVAAGFATAAIVLFNRGLRRYTSGAVWTTA